MKRLIGAVMAVALLVSVAPVLAGDSFYALSRLPAGLSQLDDAQLATIEGGDSYSIVQACGVCYNYASIEQENEASQRLSISYSVVYGDVEQELSQSNDADVRQSINSVRF